MKSIYVRDDLHRRMKLIAAEQGRSLGEVVEEYVVSGLREADAQRAGWEQVALLSKELYAEAEELAGLSFDYAPEDEAELAQAALVVGDLIPELDQADEELG